MSAVLARHNVKVLGQGEQPMIFAHGYGCDQNMWRFITPAFEDRYRIILFDHVGHGQSDATAFDRTTYASLNGYADDVLAICRELDLTNVIFVGHSVSAMIGVLAAIKEPERFDRLVLIGPSPRYINDGDYVGGFKQEDIEGLLDFLDSNHLGWSSTMAPVIMGNPDRPGARRGADQQLLPHRPGDRQALCSRDVPLGQPGRSSQRKDQGAHPPVLAGCDCSRGGRALRASEPPGQ